MGVEPLGTRRLHGEGDLTPRWYVDIRVTHRVHHGTSAVAKIV